MNPNKYTITRFGSFSSSLSPEKLARTWQGVFASIATFCGAIATFLALPILGKVISVLGISINPNDIADTWAIIATSVATLGSASFAFYGFIYKIFVAVWDKWLSKWSIFNKRNMGLIAQFNAEVAKSQTVVEKPLVPVPPVETPKP